MPHLTPEFFLHIDVSSLTIVMGRQETWLSSSQAMILPTLLTGCLTSLINMDHKRAVSNYQLFLKRENISYKIHSSTLLMCHLTGNHSLCFQKEKTTEELHSTSLNTVDRLLKHNMAIKHSTGKKI